MTAPGRIVLTRARAKCQPWRAQLERAGVATLVLPLLRHETIEDPPVEGLEPFDWILFRSPQAVRAFFDGGLAQNLIAARTCLGVLGEGTAAELRRARGVDDLGVRTLDGAGLATAFQNRIAPPASILLPGPQQPLPEPAASLTHAGFDVCELALYRTVGVPRNELPEDPFMPGDCLFFASPSAVEVFADAYAAHDVTCAALGETTARALRAAGYTPAVAQRPDLESLCAAVGIDLPVAPQTKEAHR